MKPQRKKIEGVVALTKKLMEQGAYVISNHAMIRKGQRSLTVGDIKNIIRTGYHEKRKDEYKQEFRDWNYAIHGKTLDDDQARVCIAFSEDGHFIVITVIRLEAK